MRFFGHKFRFTSRQAAGVSLAASLLLLIAAAPSPVFGQTAPYVLPYTMSTFAGPHAPYTPGDPCSNAAGVASPNLIALDTQGDGCPAPDVSVGTDSHDIRVDAKGDIFWIDKASETLIHRIDGHTLQQTVYVGSLTNTHACAGQSDTAGDNCPSTDGAANNNPNVLTTSSKFVTQRGLGLAANGDLYSAGYSDYRIHKVSASTGILSVVAGTGANGNSTSVISGPVATTVLFSPRGVGVDAAGNVYIADTSLNVVQEVVGSNIIALTAANSTGTQNVTSGVLATTAQLDAPEDVKIDSFGNVFIADTGNNVIRAIYEGHGTLPGISGPISGFIYTIAGGTMLPTGATTNTTYPSNGTAPTVSPTSVAFTGARKIALDSLNNLYIADSQTSGGLPGNVVWFVDHATGDIRVIAGSFGQTPTSTPAYVCAASTDAVGDGCPGPTSSLYASAQSMGIDPDNQGNLYITDTEGGASISRLRKLLSGLNFPAVAMNASLTQTVQIHFAPGDSLSTATILKSDFSAATPTCTVQADTTTDCLFPITFTPTVPGNDTALFTITSTKGGAATYLLTGTGNQPELAIDPGLLSSFNSTVKNAQGVAADGAGNIYIADTANNRVLKYTAATGVTSTLAGTGAASYTGDNGLATAATLNGPKAVTIDTSGSVYIADTGNNVVRRIDGSTGIITTFAGGATAVCATASDPLGNFCPATMATLSAPSGLAMDNLGQVYVSDTGNNVIRQISLSGYITTFAGGSTTSCTSGTDTLGDGCGALQSTFSAPSGLAYDTTGNYLFVADSGNSIIRKISVANTITTPTPGSVAAVAVINQVTLVAGNGQAGSSVDSGSSAILSQLNKPLGVAVDSAQNVYIADTGNSAIRLVSGSTGLISTIAGINAASGDTAVPAPAISVQLDAPAAVAVNQSGTVYLSDSANNRILADNRGQVTYNFGRTNLNELSPVQSFDELSIGTLPASIAAAAPLFTASGDTTQFTLTPPTASNACTVGATLDGGTYCVLNGQFAPTSASTFSATYTETGASPTAGGVPSITLTGTGAVLTSTTSAAAQTSPATGNAQFGASLTLTATVVPSSCNTFAPACDPTGTVRIAVDGVFGAPAPLNTSTPTTASQSFSGLSVGPHTVTCSYSGDDFYAASSCGAVTITVAPASTTSVLTATNSDQTQFPTNACIVIPQNFPNAGDYQCTATTLNATVTSSTTGTPTGNITFYASGGSLGSTPVALGTTQLTATGGATYALNYVTTPNGSLVLDSTLPVGAYSLTCTYTGVTNYATSNCTAVPYVVTPQPATIALAAYGCSTASLTTIGSPTLASVCPSPGVAPAPPPIPTVSTAQGATTDATLLIIPTNTASGTLTFACSGLPANSDCTFSPTSVTLTPGKTYAAPIGVDVTFFNDLQPVANASLPRPTGRSGIAYASLLGWPLALFGLFGLLGLGRSKRLRHLALLSTLLLIAGTSLVLTGCNGPGAYQAVLTPAGTYSVTITASGAGITQSVKVNYQVTAPESPARNDNGCNPAGAKAVKRSESAAAFPHSSHLGAGSCELVAH